MRVSRPEEYQDPIGTHGDGIATAVRLWCHVIGHRHPALEDDLDGALQDGDELQLPEVTAQRGAVTVNGARAAVAVPQDSIVGITYHVCCAKQQHSLCAVLLYVATDELSQVGFEDFAHRRYPIAAGRPESP
jgi:hypothetical protein